MMKSTALIFLAQVNFESWHKYICHNARDNEGIFNGFECLSWKKSENLLFQILGWGLSKQLMISQNSKSNIEPYTPWFDFINGIV